MPIVRGCRNRYCAQYGDQTGWCPAHRKPMFARAEPLPPGWPAIRAAQLTRAPTCQDCGARPATEVHHVRGRAAGHGPDNLRSLCHWCHATTTGHEGGSSFP
jgi:5-methylcytosine-specific restriction endonuclease McrA